MPVRRIPIRALPRRMSAVCHHSSTDAAPAASADSGGRPMPARRTLLIGSILAVTLALAGCAGEPGAPTGASTSAAATTPPPTTITPSPEPTAVDPLESVVALVARPTVLE